VARARKIDRKKAQELALKAFWLNGYTGLGVRKLEKITGINRFMLQTEFGGKEGLFVDVLDTYISLSEKTCYETVRSGNLDSLIELFLQRAGDALPMESSNGCLMINTLCEGDTENAAIKQRGVDFMDVMQSAMIQALKNEQSQGTLVIDLDINQASEMLMASLVGMNVLVKMNGDNRAVLPAAKMIEKTILSWRRVIPPEK
jgi:TetR/AcrR family transcriptional repressor of nem operon